MTKLERSLINTLIETGYDNDTLFDGTPFPDLEQVGVKEVPTLESDEARHVCGLESTLTNVTSELRGLGFPLLAGRVEDELGDLQDTIVNCGLELGQYS